MGHTLDTVALRALILVMLVAVARSAGAHPDVEAASVALPGWSLEPWLLALLMASVALYATGLRALWRKAGAGRGITTSQAAAFGVGWLSLVGALVSPLDALGARLFSAHMVQHELMMVVAAPLLVLGRPLAVWAWACPAAARTVAGQFGQQPWLAAPWRFLTDPLVAWALHAIVLWLWHLPVPFQAALRSEAIHVLQHASFLASALLFWWPILKGGAQGAVRGSSMLYLFTTMVHTGALGALLTFSQLVWYPAYIDTSTALGLDPLEDQQLGGLVMWVPAGLSYLLAGLALGARWLTDRSTSTAHSGPRARHNKGGRSK